MVESHPSFSSLARLSASFTRTCRSWSHPPARSRRFSSSPGASSPRFTDEEMGRQAQRRGGEWQGQEVLCPGKGAALSSHPVGRLRPGPAEDPLTTPASGTRGSGLPAPALLGTESAFENPEGVVSLRGQFAKGASGVRREVGPAAAPNERVGQLLRPLSPSWGRGSCGHHGQTMETAPGPRTDARTAMGGKSVRRITARPRRGGGSGMAPQETPGPAAAAAPPACEAVSTTRPAPTEAGGRRGAGGAGPPRGPGLPSGATGILRTWTW